MVVATYRPDELHRRHPLRPLLAELERNASARRIELSSRSHRGELREQLTDILGGPPEPELLDRMWARSEGNPLFTEELLAAGLDGRGTMPPTLRDALMVRMERLSESAQELLRLVCKGRRLDTSLLADASGLDPAELRAGLREAVASHILSADEDGWYSFRHALLREVVADDLLPGERSEIHLALAHALEHRAEEQGQGAHLAAGIAHHYYAAGDQAAALAASVRAAEAADGVHAHGEAAALSERALELWERVPNAEEVAGIDHIELLRRAALRQRGRGRRRAQGAPAQAGAQGGGQGRGPAASGRPDGGSGPHPVVAQPRRRRHGDRRPRARTAPGRQADHREGPPARLARQGAHASGQVRGRARGGEHGDRGRQGRRRHARRGPRPQRTRHLAGRARRRGGRHRRAAPGDRARPRARQRPRAGQRLRQPRRCPQRRRPDSRGAGRGGGGRAHRLRAPAPHRLARHDDRGVHVPAGRLGRRRALDAEPRAPPRGHRADVHHAPAHHDRARPRRPRAGAANAWM